MAAVVLPTSQRELARKHVGKPCWAIGSVSVYNPWSAALLWLIIIHLWILLCQCDELPVVVPEGLKVELVIFVESLRFCPAQSGEVFPSEFLCGPLMTEDSTC